MAALASLVAAPLWAAEPTSEELQARVRELETRIASLETKTDRATEEKSATIDRLLRDAERRSQLLSAGGQLTAGYDKGFFIRSEDGSFVLRPGVQFQFRGVSNTTEDDGTEDGFEVRRIRFKFDGNVLSPDLTYSFEWDTNRSGGAPALLAAFAQYRFAPEWAVKVGQFKQSFSHENDVSFTNQLAAEISLVDTLLGGGVTGYVQGVSAIYGGTKENPIRFELSLNDGANSRNTDFRDTGGSNFGAGARVEYKPFGNWSDYKDFTARDTKSNLLVFGAGAFLTQNGDLDAVLTTADVQWKSSQGLSLYGALTGNFLDTAASGQRFDWGALAQIGYAVNRQWEVFGRYSVVLLDSDFTANDTLNEITVGVNYYLGKDGSAGHRAKITLDVGYLPDGAPTGQTGLGYLTSTEEEFVVRGQLILQL